MLRIDTTNDLFSDGDPQNNIKGTRVTAAWLNMIQEEIANAIEGLGVTLDPAKDDQLKTLLAAGLVHKILTQSGDMLYASAPETLARLAKGLANQAMFMKGDGSGPEWGETSFVGTISKDSSTAGTVTLTGVGFKASLVIVVAVDSDEEELSISVSDGTNSFGVADRHNAGANTWHFFTGVVAVLYDTGPSDNTTVNLTGIRNDEIDFQFSNTGSPTGIIELAVAAIR